MPVVNVKSTLNQNYALEVYSVFPDLYQFSYLLGSSGFFWSKKGPWSTDAGTEHQVS